MTFLSPSSGDPDISDFVRWKIVQSDIVKFLQDKSELTIEAIKAKLLLEFHHVQHLLPKNASTLPPHRPWDHKIELVPGKQAPYHKNLPFSPAELLCVHKWIDDMLAKGFIRKSSCWKFSFFSSILSYFGNWPTISSLRFSLLVLILFAWWDWSQ